MLKTAENVTMVCGGMLAFLGLAGFAGYVETGNGLIVSLCVEAIGLFLSLCSYKFGNMRRRDENDRIN